MSYIYDLKFSFDTGRVSTKKYTFKTKAQQG